MELPLQQFGALCVNMSMRGVSILVLMELPLQPMGRCMSRMSGGGFNPCFNGTTSATCFRGFCRRSLGYVSILVLMELPLQPTKRRCKNIRDKSFNPCFNGTTSATALREAFDSYEVVFQSLF